MDNPIFDFWNKLIVDMWSKYQIPVGTPFSWYAQADKEKNPWQIPLQMIQAISQSISAFKSDKKSSVGEVDSLSELVSKLMHTGMEGYLELQKKWLNSIREGASSFHETELIGRSPLIWLESIRKILGLMPNAQALGVSGASQDLIDKYVAFSEKLSELLYQLYLPMDKASTAMVKSIEETGKEGRVPQNFEEASGVWLNVLENSYLDLIKSSNYTKLLHETADAYEQYCRVRRQVYNPPAKPDQKPEDNRVDELSEEISKLRERLEELLRRVDPQIQPVNPAKTG